MNGWWSGHKVIDPSDIENRFSNESGLAYLDVGTEEVSEEGLLQIERVRGVLDQLPPREADFVDLYYFRRLRQTDIATIFGVSQPTVCYRLQRAAARIHFLLSLPEITPAEVQASITPVLVDPIDVQVMVLMQETTCQSEVAKRLGVSQGFVRHRFIRSIGKLRDVEGKESLVVLFDLISANLNILREVQRPTWGERISRVLV
jgi:DNA-directed RNA polymerase specialized sigma24 family protein